MPIPGGSVSPLTWSHATVVDVVQSYLDFMDQIHKGTTGEIRKILVQQRGELADKLAAKQAELLAARRNFADMAIAPQMAGQRFAPPHGFGGTIVCPFELHSGWLWV